MKNALIGIALLLAAHSSATGIDLRLVEAAKAKNVQAVRSLLLSSQIDVNESQPDGATALHWAAHWDDLETAELLIQAGAHPNAVDEGGATPLWLAASNGNSAMVVRLLRAGADPNAPLRLGETPLMAASEIGSLEVVKPLLSADAQVNARESQRGQTALMWALAEGHLDVARTLIEYGADILASSKGGYTPLLFAAQTGDLESVRILLAAGADVNAASPDRTTPLLLASAAGHDALVVFLLEKGADPDIRDYKGFTALHYAAMRRNMLESVRNLLAMGADPNARLVKEGSDSELLPVPDLPFLRAPTRIVRAGTRGGTFPIGATPLYLAAQQRNAEMMRLLAEWGADPHLSTTETVYFLGGSGRRVNYIAKTTPLMAAAGVDKVGPNWNDYPKELEKQALEAVQVALELGSDINAVNDYGLTALHAAAFIGADSIVELLVENGANMDSKDQYGQTPLSISRHVITVSLGDNFDVRPRRFRPSTSTLLMRLGATPLERSGVQVLQELKSSHQ